MHYFNEIDPNAAAWIRQLIEDKQIPAGHVDERSIVEVTPSDLAGYVQCHFFAGVAGWPLALQLAGWPEDRPVWTASLPCQSFSSAGKQRGTADERHLWPVFERLVRECRPPVLFGEQVASKLARTDWLPGVCLDLQNLGYSATAVDICAPCAGEVGEGRIVRGDQEAWERIILGAPHIRQRLYWVAHRGVGHAVGSGERGGDQRGLGACGQEVGEPQDGARVADEPCNGRSAASGLAQPRNDGAGSLAGQARHEGRGTVDTGAESLRQDHRADVSGGSDARSAGIYADSRMADTSGDRQQRGRQTAEAQEGREPGRDVGGELPGGSEGCTLHHWRRVSFAADCLGGDDDEPGDECSICGLTYAEDCECPGPTHDGYEYEEFDGVLYARWVGDAGSTGSQGHAGNVSDGGEPGRQHPQQARPAWSASWADSDTILCADGKARRFEPGIFPLAHGLPRGVVPSGDPGSAEYANATGEARVMRLKGYGNAINAPLAALFIQTCMEVLPE